MRVAVYFYPYWHGTDEQGRNLQLDRDSYGLLLTTVPQGKHTLQFHFRARSRLRTGSMAVSILSLAAWIAIYVGVSRRITIVNRDAGPQARHHSPALRRRTIKTHRQ